MTSLIPLHRGDYEVVGYTSIDPEDAHLGEHVWRLHSDGYAYRQTQQDGRQVRVYLHRLLLGLSPGDGLQGDHINRNRLDNRRANLRVATSAENTQNQRAMRGSRGVTWDARRSRWRAQVKLRGRNHYLGLFEFEADAAQAAADFRSSQMPFSTEDHEGATL